ncbi:hypothetical protein SARC_13809, partial [Sphaeroforma arctica JP610]
TNLMKHQIVQVYLNSQPHLSCISGAVDALLDKVSPVLYSTDPISRALLLRLYGAIAVIASDSKQIHRSILPGLDSSDKLEVQAAVFAANRIASRSKTFAVSLLGK